MNRDRIAGAAKQAKGSIKEAAGKTLGNAKLTAKGKNEKAEGKVQSAIECLKDTSGITEAEVAINCVLDNDRPAGSL
jgi:uncharacterized protein YjbJ (UPF0337 family)